MFRILILFVLVLQTLNASTQAAFTPPEGWQNGNSANLPKHVKLLIVGKGFHEMPPSISLGYETFQGSLKDYLKIVKNINDSQGDEWKDLGTIQTEAGIASLSQVTLKTEWGQLKQMHIIYLDEGIIYIVTASALKEEFPQFYSSFFDALKSFRLIKN